MTSVTDTIARNGWALLKSKTLAQDMVWRCVPIDKLPVSGVPVYSIAEVTKLGGNLAAWRVVQMVKRVFPGAVVCEMNPPDHHCDTP